MDKRHYIMKMLLKTNKTIAICWMAVFLLAGCTPNANNKTAKQLKNSAYVLVGEKHFLHDYEPYSESGTVNVVVEIPAGTLEKWEVDKTDGSMKLEFIGQNPRIVQYLAYPGNYGMIPKTILPLEQGGDGDPLDVIVLGEASLRGAVIDCKVIGVMLMRDNGEQDDKLIAVKSNSPFFNINSIAELNEKFPGVSDILKIWFLNYKGVGKIEVSGFAEKEAAEKILSTAIHEFKKSTL